MVDGIALHLDGTFDHLSRLAWYASILSAMYNKCIAGVKFDWIAISGEAGHQIGPSSNRYRPTRDGIALKL